MRVIAGKFKKANLVSAKGSNTRPTTDYLKEVIFSVCGSCADKSVLDLFAGSGALGIEAVSRGAEKCVMVDMAYNSIKAIKANIFKLKCDDICRIFKKKVSVFLNSDKQLYDLIFMDPPYDKDLVNPTLDLIFENNLLARNGKVIVERSHQEDLEDKWLEFVIYNKRHSDTVITVLKFDIEVSDETL